MLADAGEITLPVQQSDSLSQVILPEYQGIDINLDFRNVVFTHNGVYATEVLFNSFPLGKRVIYVCGMNGNV